MKIAIIGLGWLLFIGTMLFHSGLTTGESLTLLLVLAVASRVYGDRK